MRTKLLISLLIITVITVSQIIKPDNNLSRTNENGSVNTTIDTLPFFVGAYCDSREKNKSILVDTLSFNFWHTFLGNRAIQDPNNTSKLYYTPYGWSYDDSLYYSNDSINQYVKNVLDVNGAELKTLMSRPKIEWLFFAQRSDYQCEDVSALENRSYNWFYTYNVHQRGRDIVDVSQYGQNAVVRYCGTNDPDLIGIPMDSGYVVKGLISNREQVNTGNPGHGYPYPGYGDGQFSWYVKPRIRIDSSFAANIINNDTKICRIEVLNYEGVVIKYQDIKVINFKQSLNSQYHGNYMETFYSQPNAPIDLTIESGWQMNPNDKVWSDDKHDLCLADYRVFWYGKCDMWIDYVRVEDQRAYDLFGDTATNNNSRLYREMLKQEVRNAKYGTSPLMFYIDEFEFNHIPAITFVMKKLQQYAGTQSLPFVLATNNSYNDFYKLHIPTDSTLGLNHFKRYCLDSCKVAYYGNTATYCFGKSQYPGTDYQTYLPNTLPDLSNQCFYAKLSTPAFYEGWLQGFLISNYLNRNFIPACKDLQALTKMKPEMNSFISVQTHAHNAEDYLREPTNEEIRMMVNTAVSYGIKGIIYYSYDAFGQHTDGTVNQNTFDVGLTNKLGDSAQITPRYTNFYGQRKWESIVKTNKVLKRWTPYLRTFGNTQTKSYVYNILDERSLCLSETYFSDIITCKPGSGDPACTEDNPGGNLPAGLTYDCINERYIQAATFQTNANDVNKYFMIVNRRCSPYVDITTEDRRGGKRNVRVRFKANSSEFANFNNWKIIDIENDSTILTFDKRTSTILDLGWYMPGQGKLYKIAAVMREGGTLITDETVSGSFTCKGKVYNGGYNISILPSTTISFSGTAGIEMNGGTFTSGINNTNNIQPVNLKGLDDSNNWCGLILSNCSSIGIYNTCISKIKADDTAKAVLILNSKNINIKGCSFNVGNNSGAIQAVFISNNEETTNINFNISNCSFNMGQSSYSAISISSSASSSLPVNIEWCNFSTSCDTTNAILMSGVTGGAIKNNTFTNFASTINTLGSTIDLFGNKILGKTNSKGIFCVNSSNISLSPISGNYLGGFNYFKNYGTSSSCISSDNSIFDINCGLNNFDLNDLQNSKFFIGTYGGDEQNSIDAIKNCFHKDSITNVEANHSVVWNQSGNPVNFIFTDYSCDVPPPTDFFVILNSVYNDTVYRTIGGTGGGFNPNKTISI